ncbi:MAG TPA: primosomal protein N' [Solirubrobacteraceae bacterium]|jgi:primosomal protein N' (replication factor Y)|nr:primosomal protein N' [Solirubrobacteraceae bacterium]
MIARVEPLTRTRAVRGPFDYRLAPGQDVEVGSLLRVPFGARSSLGVVVELAERSELDPDRLVEPEAVIGAGVGADLVALAGWMAREYCSTPSRALQLMLAPGASVGTGAKLALVAELTVAGSAALADDGARLNDRQRGLLLALAQRGPTAAAELDTPGLRRLESRGLVAIDRRARPRRPVRHEVGSASATAPPLTSEQSTALDRLLQALRAPVPDHPGFLLQGVTGSGKTEVYLGAVDAALQAGRTAIVLVPEIALTPQVLWRFQARFGDVVAVQHSALSVGERHDEWMRLRAGEARVCVGPRSAVFAPLDDIGLIVVDEEHESSYKHEGDPRYDARTVARERAARHGAVLVVGSATPRPESVLAMQRLRLTQRVDRRPMPGVEVLDMRDRHQPLHPETRMALADLRRAGGKAILLLNRRGWSNFLSCRACGRVWLCPNCDVALVLHRHGHFIACHHCGHRERMPDRCSACASVSVARHGAGTERIEHELREALGSDPTHAFPIFRLDADSPSLPERARTLQRFQAAPAGVLVGTQMVAKGHDFPDVSLGVVLDADQTLRFPDFRAEERTFALITQLAGRTGRGALPSRVLVQTLAPDARPIGFATRHDSEGFIADELERRRALSYPPYASLIRVVCSAEDDALAREAATAIHGELATLDAAVLGPAPLFRLRGRARSQLVIKAQAREAAISAVGRAVDLVAPGAARRGASVSVDVDPQ